MKARDSVGQLYGVGFIRTGSNGDYSWVSGQRHIEPYKR